MDWIYDHNKGGIFFGKSEEDIKTAISGLPDKGSIGTSIDSIGSYLLGEDFGSLSGSLKSWLDSMSGYELTNAQVQQNIFNAEQADLAFQRQLDFYEKYQSVSALRGQYEESGLNPALMYGNSAGASTAPSSTSASGSQSSNPMALVSLIMQLAGFKANIDKTKAETSAIQEQTKKTSQEILTEQQNTEVARQTAAEIGTRTRISVERWNQETVKIAEEISLLQSQTERTDAEKEKLIQEKLVQEAVESYERWKADNAALMYWVDTGLKAAHLIVQGAGVVVNWKNVGSLVKARLSKDSPSSSSHSTDVDEFVSMLESF